MTQVSYDCDEDDGIRGVTGALRFLAKWQPTCTSLSIRGPFNDDGVVCLFECLAADDAPYGPQEVTAITLNSASMTDRGLRSVLRYCAANKNVTRVDLRHNDITLEDEEIATLLNGSNVDHLVLGMNWLDSRGTSVFFNALDAPSLTCLFMDHCCLAGDVVPAVADFVAAPRTNGLVDLVLRRNADFDVAQCTCILDAIEGANYTLLSVTAVLPDDVPVFLRRRAEDLETRNNLHHTRLIRATLKGLVAARIILHGRQPIAEDGDMEDTGTDTDSSRRRRRRGSRTPSPVYVRNTYRWALHRDQAGSAASQSQQPEAEDPSRQQETIVPGTERQQASPPRPFPLLRLPREIQLLIARYCTEDETALSESQWRRVIRHASDPDSLSRKARDWAAWCHRVKARVPMEKRLVREFLWTQMKELGCFSWEWNEGRAPPLPTAVAASV